MKLGRWQAMWQQNKIWLWLCALALLLVVGCVETPRERVTVQAAPAGDREAGRLALQEYGCHSCHHIPGVIGADAYVGPPLDAWAERSYIAGSLPNEPEHLVQWIRFPQAIEPGTAMPNLEVSEEAARNMAAYLYTLRSDADWYADVVSFFWIYE